MYLHLFPLRLIHCTFSFITKESHPNLTWFLFAFFPHAQKERLVENSLPLKFSLYPPVFLSLPWYRKRKLQFLRVFLRSHTPFFFFSLLASLFQFLLTHKLQNRYASKCMNAALPIPLHNNRNIYNKKN